MRTDNDPDGPGASEATGRTDVVETGDSGSSPTFEEASGASTASEEAALRRVRGLSQLLDEAVRVPGTDFRVGLDPVMGILPVGGDAVATVFALYPILEAVRFGLPTATIVKMVLVVAVDSVIGSIPVVGTVFDAFWKANEWNARALERHLESV